MAQAAKSILDLGGYIARCCDEILAKAVYEMDSGERRTLECRSKVQQGDGMGPPLFFLILVPIIIKLQKKYEPLGVSIKAYMDDINLHLQELTEESLKALSDLEDELTEVGKIVSRRKSSALPPQGHQITDKRKRLLDGAGITVAEAGITVVGVPIGSDAYVEECAIKVIRDRGAEKLARMLPRMSDRQVAFLTTSLSLTERSVYIAVCIHRERNRQRTYKKKTHAKGWIIWQCGS